MNDFFQKYFILLALGASLTREGLAAPPDSFDFDRRIAPLIAQRCLSCHEGAEPKGQLDLSSRVTAQAGGEQGRVIEPGDPKNSRLWDYINSNKMPPKKPLNNEEKESFKAWIESGAAWGQDKIDVFRFTTRQRAGFDWWALSPLRNVIPPVGDHSRWALNPIDAFIRARLEVEGLTPSAEADKRALIRRLSFDLLGLPPTAEELEQFLADESDQAYEHLVDRMLKSVRYGERWARHWLDIVRFGESNGFEYDEPRDNFWHYRNWVIQALNEDRPYDEFARQQLAGDVLHPGNVDAMAATGFLVAGPHNTTLPANDAMRMSMAQDELEDLVGIVGQTFLGLTVNCARCHDHKFDPISQKEYYQLAATLAGVKHGERTVRIELPGRLKMRGTEIDARLLAIRRELDAISQSVSNAILATRKLDTATSQEPPKALATWEFDGDLKDSRGTAPARAIGGARVENGALVLDGKKAYVETDPLPIDLEEKTLEAWVELDNLDQRGGGVIGVQTLDGSSFDAIVFAEREPKKWMAGSNGFARTKPFNGPTESAVSKSAIHVAIVYDRDGTITGYRDGQLYGQPYRPREIHRYTAGNWRVLMGMRHGPAGGNKMLAGRIRRACLYNRALTADEIASSARIADRYYVPDSEIEAQLSDELRERYQKLNGEMAQLQQERSSLTAMQSQTLYACVSSDPGVTRVLRRGNVTDPGEEAFPSGLRALHNMPIEFELAADATDAHRRAKLAEWIAHPQNALFARVMVNRLWQYHFGQGLVSTPSDFGFQGGRPNHEEMLDWLAQEFRKLDFHIKPIHRLIVTSATYRQSSAPNSKAAKLDADNRFLWRKSPLRLEAEAIRDSVLFVAGSLNTEYGGKGYRDVRHFPFKGSNFYESLAESGTDDRRRTIYRFSPRGGHNPFLVTFDCPDPSATAPKRTVTSTPLQSLALMNNALMLELADEFARRVQRDAGEVLSKQIELVYRWAYGREALDDDIRIASRFVERHGLPALCRVIFNSNEFIFIR